MMGYDEWFYFPMQESANYDPPTPEEIAVWRSALGSYPTQHPSASHTCAACPGPAVR